MNYGCRQLPQKISFPEEATLETLVAFLTEPLKQISSKVWTVFTQIPRKVRKTTIWWIKVFFSASYRRRVGRSFYRHWKMLCQNSENCSLKLRKRNHIRLFLSRFIVSSKSSSCDKGCLLTAPSNSYLIEIWKKFKIQRRLLNLGVYWTDVSSCEGSSGYLNCIFDSTAIKLLLKVWCSLAQNPKLIVVFCFFPQKCFPGSSGDSECSFFKHVWKYLPKVQFFYSKSVDFFKFIFIVEKQHFSSKLSSGHVGRNFDRHAFVFHKSYFFWLKFQKK